MMAASAAITRPAPSSHVDAVANAALVVDQKPISQTSAATKNAIGNGMSIGWMGCPAMLAVERGLAMAASIGKVPGLSTRTRNCGFRCNRLAAPPVEADSVVGTPYFFGSQGT